MSPLTVENRPLIKTLQTEKAALLKNDCWEMFSVNFVTFTFCKLFFCHDSLENVTGVDAFN